MTISNTTNRRVYTGPGDEFTYDFPVFADADIYVVIVEEDSEARIEPDLNGSDTYDFSVSGSFDSTALRYPNGVTVTLNNSLPDDTYTIAIECRPAQTQSTDYVNGGPLNAERLETDLDRLVTIAQFFAGEIESAVRVSPTSDTSIPPLVPQANAILVWNSDGTAVVSRSVFGRWRDVWATDTLYVELDIVRFEENGDAKDGNIYLCAEEHTSDVFDTDLAAGRWQLIIDVAAVENAKDAAEAAQTAAETAETNAAASESAAATSETNAATSESAAATSETNAAASETLAEQWASEDEDVVVADGKFSSYHWAQKTEDYAAMAVADEDVIFPNVSSVELADIPAGVQALFVQGYTSAGDGGGALYKRVGSEPGHPGKIQSADGAWWELAEVKPNILMFGAVGNGGSLDTAALQNAMAYSGSEGRAVLVPSGKFLAERMEYPSGASLIGVDREQSEILMSGSLDPDDGGQWIKAENIPGDGTRPNKNVSFKNLTFNGENRVQPRWLQDWNDGTEITDPENDYDANGGGIGNTGTNYIADDDYIAAAQTVAGGNTFTLSNIEMPLTEATSGASGYRADRRIRVVSSGDDSGISFEVVGTTFDDSAMSETIGGTNAGIAEGENWFKSITSVTPDGGTDGNVSIGIEEYDIGSAASAGRRNPYYRDGIVMISLDNTEDSYIGYCTFKNYNGMAINEGGGLDVCIEANLFDTIGKDDGPFPAIRTQSRGNPQDPGAGFTDSKNVVIRNNVARGLERSFVMLGTSAGGGVVEGNYVTGWGESCIFCPPALNFNGGVSEIRNNHFEDGTLTDIAGAGVEMAAHERVNIYNNYFRGTPKEGMLLRGCKNIKVKGNTFEDCFTATAYPYGPFSERYGFNIGETPIAGDGINITDGRVIPMGIHNDVGGAGNVIDGNTFLEGRGTFPSIFGTVRTGSATNIAGEHLIQNNDITGVPAGMEFFDDSTSNVFEDGMPLRILNNIGHVSEGAVRIDHTFLGDGTTGGITFDVGFRPSAVQVIASDTNASLGQSWNGLVVWSKDGSDTEAGISTALYDGSGIYSRVRLGDFIRIVDASNTIRHLSEFVRWTEKGFVIGVTTDSTSVIAAIYCYP